MAGSVKENSGASGAFKLLCRTFPPRPTLRPRFPDAEGQFFTLYTGFLVSGTRPDGAGSESQPVDDYLAHSFKGAGEFLLIRFCPVSVAFDASQDSDGWPFPRRHLGGEG